MLYSEEDKSTSDSSSDSETQCKYKKGTTAWTNHKLTQKILPRPNASDGYWLCALLPLAFCTRYLHNVANTNKECATSTHNEVLTTAAIGMCVQSFCFFIYMHIQSWIFLKLFVSLMPSLLTSALFKFAYELAWSYGLLYGFVITFCYQNVYTRVMRGLPKCFTYGEAGILIQGLMLFTLNVLLKLWHGFDGNESEFTQLNVIMMCALFLLLIACQLLYLFQFLREPLGFYGLMIALLLGVTCAPFTTPMPIVALFEFLVKKQRRLIYVCFFFVLVFVTIAIVCWQLRNAQKASTRVRKIFHALIILVYIPGLIHECAFLYIATGVALAIFTVLELFRILNIPPLGDTLKSAFASFSDEKDAGILALTPFSLLIGCSLPIWLYTCPCGETGSTNIALLAGILSTGIGDAAASVIGSKFGRIKWSNDSSRTIEGSVAFVVAVLLASFILAVSGFISMSLLKSFVILIATIATAYVEAHTDQIDNLVLPLVFYIIVNLVQ